MTVGRVAWAAGVAVVFGVAALLMGRSAWRDWREGREETDRVTQFHALQQMWPALLALAMAVGAPVIIVLSG